MVRSKLKQILKERGMKQTFIAEHTGLSTTAVSSICRGQNPTIENALKIAKVLGVSVEDIWTLGE